MIEQIKKNSIPIVLALVLGLGIGYLLFGGKSSTKAVGEDQHNHVEQEQMWTCSMHPQIMQPEPGDCPICGMDLIPAHTIEGEASGEGITMSENAMALADIQTWVVGKSSGSSNSVTLSGMVKPNENGNATQSAHFNGRIERLYVNSVGQQVQRGQAVAQVYSPELVAAQEELIMAYGLRESQPQLYHAVRNKFKNWNITDSQLDEVEQSGVAKSNFTIYSHVAGVVTEINVNQGGHVLNGGAIFKTANLASVWAEFDVYENQIHLFKLGDSIQITASATPGKAYRGKVTYIDPIMDPEKRTVQLRVALDNPKGALKPGMFVTGRVVSKGREEAATTLSIPASAVIWTGKRSLVYIKTTTDVPSFEMREVALGSMSGDRYMVLDGLSAGVELVVNGAFTVDAAAQLQGKKSMMNRDGGPVTTGHEGHIGMQPQQMDMYLPKEFQEEIRPLINSYLVLKDALVASNPSLVQQESQKTITKFEEINTSELEPMVQAHWKKVRLAWEAIAASSDLSEQRKHFVILSENTIALGQQIQNLEKPLYVQYCPMANSDQGARWLSLDKEIKNPYYGEAMLKCGEIRQQLK